MSKMIEYKGYHATIEFDAEDNIFVGEVFGLADSLSFHGTSVDELKTMFHQSIDNYLETCEKLGKEPDKEFSGSFNVRISPVLHRQISRIAAERGISLNSYINSALENAADTKVTEGRNSIFIKVDIDNLQLTPDDRREAKIYGHRFGDTAAETERTISAWKINPA